MKIERNGKWKGKRMVEDPETESRLIEYLDKIRDEQRGDLKLLVKVWGMVMLIGALIVMIGLAFRALLIVLIN